MTYYILATIRMQAGNCLPWGTVAYITTILFIHFYFRLLEWIVIPSAFHSVFRDYISQDPLKYLAWVVKHITAYEAVTNIHRWLTILCNLKHMHQANVPVNVLEIFP